MSQSVRYSVLDYKYLPLNTPSHFVSCLEEYLGRLPLKLDKEDIPALKKVIAKQNDEDATALLAIVKALQSGEMVLIENNNW
jgi:hypothetical protein